MYMLRLFVREFFTASSKGCSVGAHYPSSANLSVKMNHALVVSKLSRYEFERYRYRNLSEEQLEAFLRKRGSDFEMIFKHHCLHKEFEKKIHNALVSSGIETQVVNRFNYTEESIKWADVIIVAGGDGTFLLAASRIAGNSKPLIGFNSDPDRSRGHLCLPEKYSENYEEAIEKLKKVFIGENLSARVSYLEVNVDGKIHYKVKSSGLCVCTGTGSTSWHMSINQITHQTVAEIANLLGKPIDANEAHRITECFNNSLKFSPEDKRMRYTIRDLISTSVWPNPKGIEPRGYASSIEVKSHCIDAGLVIDGGISFQFSDGIVAVLEVHDSDALCTIVLNE